MVEEIEDELGDHDHRGSRPVRGLAAVRRVDRSARRRPIPGSGPAPTASPSSCTRRVRPGCRRAPCSPIGNLFAMVRAAGPAWGFRPGMTSLGVSPLFHIAGSGWNLMVLAYGGHVVLHREVDAEAILRDIPRYGVTHAILVPAILQMLVTQALRGRRRRLDPRDGRLRRLADQRRRAARAVRRVRLRLRPGLRPDRDERRGDGAPRRGPRPRAGRSSSAPAVSPLPGVELRIVDPDTGDECADGEVGEVLIRSEQVMAGYWNQPEATAEAISRRRVVPLRRRRLPRRGRPPLPARPHQGHDRVGRPRTCTRPRSRTC